MRIRTRITVATVCVAGLLWGPSCQSRSLKRTKVRISAASYTSLIHLPLVLARELGYFADEGLDVTIDDAAGASKALQSLIAGSADVVSSLHDQILLMAAHGRDLKSFVLMLRAPGVALVASPAGRIRSVRELRGGTVAVTAPGSPVHLYVTHILVKNGISPDQVSFVGTASNAARVSALEHGAANAAILGEPGLTVLARRYKNLAVLADLSTPAGLKVNFGTEVYPGTVLISTADWLQKNPVLARQLAAAVQRSLRWCHEHTAREIAEKMPPDLRLQDRSTYEEAVSRMLKILSSDGMMPLEAVEAEKRMLSLGDKIGTLAKVDAARTFTNQYLTRNQ